MRGFAIAALAVSLAACEAQNPQVADPSETSIPVEPDAGIGDGAGPIEVVEAAIPERFHGVWDYIEGTCARESDLRIDISSREIVFYEAVGTVSDAQEVAGGTLVVLAMEGEGETWQSEWLLVLREQEPFGEVIVLYPYMDGQPELTEVPPRERKRCPQ